MRLAKFSTQLLGDVGGLKVAKTASMRSHSIHRKAYSSGFYSPRIN